MLGSVGPFFGAGRGPRDSSRCLLPVGRGCINPAARILGAEWNEASGGLWSVGGLAVPDTASTPFVSLLESSVQRASRWSLPREESSGLLTQG